MSIGLSRARDERGQGEAPLAVELGEDVVEQDERTRAGSVGEGLRLGQNERENRDPLLALRAVATQVTPVRLHPHLVEMWPGTREPSLEVARRGAARTRQP